jgi:hypothetical protein
MKARSFTIDDLDGVEVHTGVDVDDYVTAWHFHDEWQLVHLLAGARSFAFGSRRVDLARGSTLVIPPGIVHRGFGGRASFVMWYLAPDSSALAPGARPRVAMSPRAYRIQHRLNAARRLLHHETITDVAAALGFADQSHFGRQFRRAFGLTPGEFVKLHGSRRKAGTSR